jgi:vancomycin resistance protein VanW
VIKPSGQAHLFEGKLHNLALAVERMHGLVLEPRGVFSFWERVGAPVTARGFVDGPSFLGGAVVATPGGGLCQLSGLLYNLALLAGCRIHERHPHSIDAYGEGRYVPLGRDATVAHPSKDLRFRNVLEVPLLLELSIAAHEARGALRSTAPLPFRVELEVTGRRDVAPPVERRFDASLAVGEEASSPGLAGREVTAWRRIGSERELLSRDAYRATPTVIRYGPSRHAAS